MTATQHDTALAALLREAKGFAGEADLPLIDALDALWQNASDELEPTAAEEAVAAAAPAYGAKDAFFALCEELTDRLAAEGTEGTR